MPNFFHELPAARDLFATLANEMGLDPFLVEKDYWITHCLWGLQQNQFEFEMKGGTSLSKGWCCIDRFSEDIDIRFDPPPDLNTVRDKQGDINARLRFYDQLSNDIQIPGMIVERDRSYDDESARNGGIRLIYGSHFSAVTDLTTGILLEVGFARTAPNEPQDFTSWVLEKAMKARLEIVDNRAPGVKCFNPEYTFVDKLQTLSRRFRQYKERSDPMKDRPAVFLRHYYDLYRLLDVDRVKSFIGTEEYKRYKAEKLKGLDLAAFNSGSPFKLDEKAYQDFEKDYEHVKRLLWTNVPAFQEVIRRITTLSEIF